MKDNVEIGHLFKFVAFRLNRDQVMDFKILSKIPTNTSKFEDASPLINSLSDVGQMENLVMNVLFGYR